jgi:SNF2-related domain
LSQGAQGVTIRRTLRIPIEKHGDAGAQAFLSRRLKPFMLRRTKEEVAKELPPKTEIIELIRLEGAQRDLYETVRSLMHARGPKPFMLAGKAAADPARSKTRRGAHPPPLRRHPLCPSARRSGSPPPAPCPFGISAREPLGERKKALASIQIFGKNVVLPGRLPSGMTHIDLLRTPTGRRSLGFFRIILRTTFCIIRVMLIHDFRNWKPPAILNRHDAKREA